MTKEELLEFNKISAYVLKILFSKDYYEDYRQELWIKYQRLRNEKTTLNGAYIIQNLQWYLLDLLRKDKNKIECMNEEVLDYIADNNWQQSFLNQELQEGIKKLEWREAQVLKLYYWQGYKLKEIAKIMKLSRSGVHKIKMQAMKKLKFFLRER